MSAVEIEDRRANEIRRPIDDPGLIEDHYTALEVMETLDREIASIEAQCEVRGDYDYEWWVRARTARKHKERKMLRVRDRDREIRGILRPIKQIVQKEQGEGIAKQALMQEQAAALREQHAAEKAKHVAAMEKARTDAMRIADGRAFAKVFVSIADELLDRETVARLHATTHARIAKK